MFYMSLKHCEKYQASINRVLIHITGCMKLFQGQSHEDRLAKPILQQRLWYYDYSIKVFKGYTVLMSLTMAEMTPVKRLEVEVKKPMAKITASNFFLYIKNTGGNVNQ